MLQTIKRHLQSAEGILIPSLRKYLLVVSHSLNFAQNEINYFIIKQ